MIMNAQITLQYLRNQSNHISVTDIMITSNIEQKNTQHATPFFRKKGTTIKINQHG